MRVLVTGCGGHVGLGVARHLLERGFSVTGLNRRPIALPGLSAEISVDIGAPAFLEQVRVLEPCDAVVHAAASLSLDGRDITISRTNCLGTHHVLELARRWRAQHFVFLSSIGVIGTPVHRPVREDHPVTATTVYHASKLYGEHLVQNTVGGDLKGSILRLTSPVGPGTPDDGRIVSVFVRQALAGRPLAVRGHGTRRQNYVDVRDVAQAVERCLRPGTQGTFNIGGATSISNAELARACIDILDSRSEVTFGPEPDPQEGIDWQVCIEKALGGFGYQPRHDIGDSIRYLADERRASRA